MQKRKRNAVILLLFHAKSYFIFRPANEQPMELLRDFKRHTSKKVIKQKIEYIHNNPLEIDFVDNAVDWKYTSARNYQGENIVLEIDNVVF